MEAPICRNCKIFFGCQEGLCSKCFKECKTAPVVSLEPSVPGIFPRKASEESKETQNAPVPCPDKCFKCSKLLGPVNFKCRCENFFCTKHRYPEDHQCSFDHKAVGIRKLSEDNPLVEAPKFNRIQ